MAEMSKPSNTRKIVECTTCHMYHTHVMYSLGVAAGRQITPAGLQGNMCRLEEAYIYSL